jgi:hypothetical protein
LVASDEATSGSVIAKHDLISPSKSGSKYFFFYSLLAYNIINSMFPVSGAEQLNISGA